MIQESGSMWIYERPFIYSFFRFRLRRGSEPYVRGGGGDTGGGAAPASSIACHSSPLAPASLKVTGREANCRTCCSTSRTLRTRHMPRPKKESDADSTPSRRRESRQPSAPVLWLTPQQILSTYWPRGPIIAQLPPSWRTRAGDIFLQVFLLAGVSSLP